MLNFRILMSPNKTIPNSNIIKKYLSVLEVISSLNCEIIQLEESKKVSDLAIVALSLNVHFICIQFASQQKSK